MPAGEVIRRHRKQQMSAMTNVTSEICFVTNLWLFVPDFAMQCAKMEAVDLAPWLILDTEHSGQATVRLFMT
jgi:hypothetical protein